MSASSQAGAGASTVRMLVEGLLDPDWYAREIGAGSSLLDVVEHFLEHGLPAGRGLDARSDALLAGADPGLAQSVVEIVKSSPLFDADFYLRHNPDVARSGVDPAAHFARYGWREFRNPGAGFDVWWYLTMHLPHAGDLVNPLLHHALVGGALGLHPVSDLQRPRPGVRIAGGAGPRRVCLFAGYDADGRVDDYVVRYVRELSRHADVYYLADCWMAPEELERLAPFVKGAWAERHGTYDFGSWSRLATTHVGWEAISAYDELLLVNDSCYLVRPLGQVFAKMDATPCDWWGLQATKRDFLGPAPLPTVADLVDTLPDASPESRHVNHLHVSSYLVAYRRSVVSDPGFRRLLESVSAEPDKSRIILKYEIGLSRYLLASGLRLATFVDHLHPYHPAYTEEAFALLERGFPLLKRLLLSDNPLAAADVSDWKSRLQAIVADAPVEEMERNLLRVADDDKLQRSFSVRIAGDGRPLAPKLLTGEEMAREDQRTPKFDHWWAFPVCAYDHLLTGNERAVFEQVRDDPSIRKIVLTRGRRVSLDGENVVVCPLDSPEGQYHLLRAKQIFVKHSPRINAKYPISAKLHNFINLWHGIPLKRFGPASLDMEQKLDWVYRENRDCRAVISSSKVDALAMAAAFYPLPYREVWITGLPRNDFIVCPESRLPSDFLEEGRRLEAERAGRKLVLFAPTFKNAQADGYYRFSEEELDWLRNWMAANDAVLGVREHMADRAHSYHAQLALLGALDLSAKRYPNIEVLYRQASMLLTDYSSCAIDFSLTGRPVISFAYDFEHYAGTERGLFYDLDHVFPGPVCRDFASLSVALSGGFEGARDPVEAGLRHRTFFDYDDDGSARRVAHRVRALASDSTPRLARA